MSRFHPERVSGAVFASLFLAVSCAPGGVELPADAGDEGPPPLEPSELFGACTDDKQCPGTGAFCRKNTDGFPGGVCTRPCTDRDDCFVGASNLWNFCEAQSDGRKLCEQRCVNGLDCGRSGYSCFMGSDDANGLCRAVCSSDAECGEGAFCNRDSATCLPSTTVVTGAANGSTCDANADCRSGACLAEVRNGTPSGYLGGLCRGPCILPVGWNTSTIFADDTFSPGTCSGDAICLPNGDFSRGSLGTCVPACVNDSDCHEGYSCLRTLQLSSGDSKTWNNGWCTPIDCTKKACPSGYLCEWNGSDYVCAKDTQ